jgi:hypothetical protein
VRRDVFIANDSGALSVVAADALDAIIADGRADDVPFVSQFKAMLLELYGDDSMPVRIVVDEPLTGEESAQWLARATWRLDTTDGRLLVMGGFDPDVMSSWVDATGGTSDDRSVALIDARPGAWRVDIYAHVGSMNGRAVLDEGPETAGVLFRRAHNGRGFPLWLANTLAFSSGDDPGHEDLWADLKSSIASGALKVDFESGHTVGFVVHVTPFSGATGAMPDGGWFPRDAGARIPSPFPLGLPSEVEDPNLRAFADSLLGREAPEPPREPAQGVIEIIEVWSGEPLKKIAGDAAVTIAPSELFHLYWLAALGADSPPRFELWVDAKEWTSPVATPEFAVAQKAGRITAIGPGRELGGWQLWWAARSVSALLSDVPDKASIDFAMAPRLDHNADLNPAVGRMLFSGVVSAGRLQIKETSPLVDRSSLDRALEFVRDVEREAGASQDDERLVLMAAAPKFRKEFGTTWVVDPD